MRETQTETLRLNGFTRAQRHQMIPLIREALLQSGADILDAHFFSNISLCINFELHARYFERLQTALAGMNLQLSTESLESLTALRTSAQRDDGETSAAVPGTLQITFVHSEADLRIEVPPIPG